MVNSCSEQLMIHGEDHEQFFGSLLVKEQHKTEAMHGLHQYHSAVEFGICSV